MGYTSESIYLVYFSNSQHIDTIQDLEFDKSYDYEEIGITAKEVLLFSFSKLKPLTDSIFNTPVRDKELFATPLIFSASHSSEDDSDLLFAYYSDNNSPPVCQRLRKVRHELT